MNLDDILRDYPLCYYRTDIKLPPAKPIPSGTYSYEELERMLDGWYPVKVTYHGLDQSIE